MTSARDDFGPSNHVRPAPAPSRWSQDMPTLSPGPQKRDERPAEKVPWGILLAVPVAGVVALGLHLFAAANEPPAEAFLYTYCLTGLLIATVIAAAIQPLWSGLRKWMRETCPLIAAAVFFLVQKLPHDTFMSWGWRVPFLLSIVIFGVGVYIRSRLPESTEFAKAAAAGKTTHTPVLEAIRRHPKELLIAMGLRVAENGGSYIFLAFSLVYGKFIGVPSSVMLAGVMVSMTVELGMMLVWGRLSDRIGRKPVYMIGAVGLIVIALPFFWLIDTKVPGLIWLAFLLANGVCHGAMIGTQPSLMGELFSTEVRYSGMALGHEIASVFAGGLSPLVATALLAKYHAAWPVALMLMAMGAITVVALLCARETAQRSAR